MATARPIGEIGRDIRKVVETEIRTTGLALLREAKLESPVGQPRLWQSGRAYASKSWKAQYMRVYKKAKAPAGYRGGTFRRAWAYTWLKDRLLFIVGNPMPYSVPLAFEGHSKQVPKPWLPGMVKKVLQSLRGRKASMPAIVSGGSGGAATFGGGK